MISRRFKEKYLYREIYPKDERGRLKIATRDSSVLVLRANIGKTTFVDPQVLYLPKTWASGWIQIKPHTDISFYAPCCCALFRRVGLVDSDKNI